jgi:hypothetical protein
MRLKTLLSGRLGKILQIANNPNLAEGLRQHRRLTPFEHVPTGLFAPRFSRPRLREEESRAQATRRVKIAQHDNVKARQLAGPFVAVVCLWP